MELVVYYIVGGMLFFSILYFIVRGAVEDGIVNALIRFEEIKKHKSESTDSK